MFLLSTIDQALVSFDNSFLISEFIISINFVLIHLIVIYLASEYNNHQQPIRTIKLVQYGIVTIIALLTLKSLLHFDVISSDRENLKFLIGEPFRIVAGFMLIYSFTNSKLIVKSKRTSIISSFWMAAAVMMLISGIIQFSIYSLDTVFDLNGAGINSSWTDFAVLSGDINAIFLALIATIMALFYPENMLLTHVQLIKAARIYKILEGVKVPEEINKLPDRSRFRNLSSDSLYDYVNNLPDDIIERLDLEKREKKPYTK